MSRAFVREAAIEEAGIEAEAPAGALPPGGRHYMTPAGYARLEAELRHLVETERPEVVKAVSWAASNGDRSENGDYIYGKRRLREIDRRLRYLVKRLENADVVHSAGRDSEQVFFGAAVRIASAGRGERILTIVGEDEADPARGLVSYRAPVARALLKARAGDTVTLVTPAGPERLEILEVRYPQT